MDINKLCYFNFGSLSLQYKHKYRMLSKNPVDPVNHVKKKMRSFLDRINKINRIGRVKKGRIFKVALEKYAVYVI